MEKLYTARRPLYPNWVCMALTTPSADAVQRLRFRFMAPSRARPTARKIAPINPNVAIAAKSDTYWQVAKDGMWRVINGHEGTGRRAFANTPYKAAGKSGTAQVVGLKENQVYNAATTKVEHRDNALFVAFAPFEAPKAVVALVLENAGGGSAMGAPVARHMLDAYLLPPEPQLPPGPDKPSTQSPDQSEAVPNE